MRSSTQIAAAPSVVRGRGGEGGDGVICAGESGGEGGGEGGGGSDGAIGTGVVCGGSIGDGIIGDGSIGDGSIADGSIGVGSIGVGSIGDGLLWPAKRWEVLSNSSDLLLLSNSSDPSVLANLVRLKYVLLCLSQRVLLSLSSASSCGSTTCHAFIRPLFSLD